MNAPVSGSSNLQPDYNKETTFQRKKSDSLGAESKAKGIDLTKDSLEVPYEQQQKIYAAEAEAGRPFLPPLFRTRFVDDHQVEDLTYAYYLELRDQLPSYLKEKLEKDEKIVLSDRDPDLVAMDMSLKFEANLLALADTFAIPNADEEKSLLGAKEYMNLPEIVQQEISTYGINFVRFLDQYLANIGPNDPSFEILFNVSNQIKEAVALMNLKIDKVNKRIE